MRNNVYSDIFWYKDRCFYLYLEKNENFQNFMYNIWQIVRRWHHQLTHLNIHIKGLVKKCFPKKLEISKFHNFLISYPIFIIFAPICREIFTLSFEIMVILDWSLDFPFKEIYSLSLE